MAGENYEGLSVGERLGCGLAGLAGLACFMFLFLIEALRGDAGSTNGLWLNVVLPTLAFTAIVFFVVRWLTNTVRK